MFELLIIISDLIKAISTIEYAMAFSLIALFVSFGSMLRAGYLARGTRSQLRSLQKQVVGGKWHNINRMLYEDREFAAIVQEMFGLESDDDAKQTAVHYMFLSVLLEIYEARRQRLIDDQQYNTSMLHFFQSYKLPKFFLMRALERGGFSDAFKKECESFMDNRTSAPQSA